MPRSHLMLIRLQSRSRGAICEPLGAGGSPYAGRIPAAPAGNDLRSRPWSTLRSSGVTYGVGKSRAFRYRRHALAAPVSEPMVGRIASCLH